MQCDVRSKGKVGNSKLSYMKKTPFHLMDGEPLEEVLRAYKEWPLFDP